MNSISLHVFLSRYQHKVVHLTIQCISIFERDQHPFGYRSYFTSVSLSMQLLPLTTASLINFRCSQVFLFVLVVMALSLSVLCGNWPFLKNVCPILALVLAFIFSPLFLGVWPFLNQVASLPITFPLPDFSDFLNASLFSSPSNFALPYTLAVVRPSLSQSSFAVQSGYSDLSTAISSEVHNFLVLIAM